MNLNGELVGINSQILTPTGGNIGLGFAIPSNMAHQVMDQLKANGKVSRSKLGVTIQNLTADLASSMKLPDANGALVSNVEPDSAAARAGLRQGDVIVAVDGEKLADNNALRNRIAATKPGSKVAVEVLRDGKTQTLYATLDAQAADKSARAAGAENGEGEGLGMTVQPLTPEVARELQLSGKREGLVIRELDPDGSGSRCRTAAWRRDRPGEWQGSDFRRRSQGSREPVGGPTGAAARRAPRRRRVRDSQPREVVLARIAHRTARAGRLLQPFYGEAPGLRYFTNCKTMMAILPSVVIGSSVAFMTREGTSLRSARV